MWVSWDEQRIDRLEKKVDRLERKMDDGFAAQRSEARADFRLLLGVLLGMYLTMILGFAGILLQHL
jgi:tetrahydromethanopterin S-methyltransferase subunit G